MNPESKTMQIDIVSAEQEIYSGQVDHVTVTGEAGELGIMPGHTALLTQLKPGEIRLFKNGEEDIFFVSGGVLEVQPHVVTVLADTVVRASALDEMAAIEAKERAEKMLADTQSTIDFTRANAELAEAMAQLRAISKMRDRLGIK
jgi:F-type H+-transporting ATPase subunit epsilon